MDLGLSGKVAMVAAASQGIGRACAASLAAEGARVSICARRRDELERAATEIAAAGAEVMTTVVDVTEADDLVRWHADTVSKLGGVDILVTNTGGPPVARFEELEEIQWRDGIDGTLMNVVRLSRLVLPGMRARGWGRLVHLTSFVARQPGDQLTISSTLRAGISALTRTMANQVGPSGITVNAVLMGHVLSARQEHLAEVRMKEQGITRDEYFARAAAEIPLRRLGTTQEIGDVVAFLASARASYMSGSSILVDGGLTRGTF